MKEKSCSLCKTVKSAEYFYTDKKLISGLSSWCRSCQSKKNNEWRISNLERKRFLNARWAAENPEKHHHIQTMSASRQKGARALQSRAYMKSQVEELRDSYVAAKLNMPTASVPRGMLEVKRLIIQIKRILKEENDNYQ